MNNLLHELQSNILEYIDCIMDDVIIFIADIKTHKSVIKCFMFKLKVYAMLLTIKKIHTFHSKAQYMGLLLFSKDDFPIISHLGSRVKAISTLHIPITAKVVHRMCYLFSIIPTKALLASQAYK